MFATAQQRANVAIVYVLLSFMDEIGNAQVLEWQAKQQ